MVNKKLYILPIAFTLCSILLSNNIKINEVYCNPPGSDSGYEWMELYNPTNQTINMDGWKLYKAGTEFDSIYTFADVQIESQDYLLLGEAMIQVCDIYLSLAFQNGGGATDGIRIVAPDGYTDTILYDEPNINKLPDDISNPAVNFAPAVGSGYSLARYNDGIDTNNCTLDWFSSSEPTPNTSNIYHIDLAIGALDIDIIDDIHNLSTYIYNLSTQPVDNLTAEIEILLNDSELTTMLLPEIPAQDSILFSIELGEFLPGYYLTDIIVNYQTDNNLENNSNQASFLIGDSPIILNEVLYKDSELTCEWIEIFNRGECEYHVDNFVIFDAGGGDIPLSSIIYPHSFLVICNNAKELIANYPTINTENMIEAMEWTTLNNSSESLYLMDRSGTVFDSTSYEDANCPIDYSIERSNPYDDESVEWLTSIAAEGATPGLTNSNLLIQTDLELFADDLKINVETIFHCVKIKNHGLENIDHCELSCWYDETTVFSESIELADSISYNFETYRPTNGYFQIKYQIAANNDLYLENNIIYKFYNDNALPFVINEIMYNPFAEEPEWIELKFNQINDNLEDLILVVDQDTLQFSNLKQEYLIITGSEEDSLFLASNNVTCPILPILTSLSNDGEYFELWDCCYNLIETFSFDPSWNLEQKGVSIERVNPQISANPLNWAQSVIQSTPGAENSVFTSTTPSKKKLNISPNPFSPYQGEFSIITMQLPDIISRCTIRVYDLKGRLQRKIVDQDFVASQQEIIFDGRDEDNKMLYPGIYIILLEAVTANNNKVVRLQETVVIAK